MAENKNGHGNAREGGHGNAHEGGHEHEHGLYSGEHPAHAQEQTHDRLGAEILADREWMFGAFVRWSAIAVFHIIVILAFLALTQT
jgi:hypothetical protein